MRVTLQPLRPSDAAAVVAAEDEATVRWLSGGRSTVEGTADYDPDVTDGLEPGDVNIAYGVAPGPAGTGSP